MSESLTSQHPGDGDSAHFPDGQSTTSQFCPVGWQLPLNGNSLSRKDPGGSQDSEGKQLTSLKDVPETNRVYKALT